MHFIPIENETIKENYLHKGGVYGAEGLPSFDRQTCCESHRMLLGDTHIVGTLREAAADLVKSRAARHRSSDTHLFKSTEINPKMN